MASVLLTINNGSVIPRRQVRLRAKIGNQEQECEGGYETGGPTAPGTFFASTLATANALAVAALDCLPPEALWYLVSEDLTVAAEEDSADNPAGWALESESP